MDHGGAGEEIKLRNLGANEALVISHGRFVLVVTQLKPSHLAHLFCRTFCAGHMKWWEFLMLGWVLFINC
jgi:hypothetical protein